MPAPEAITVLLPEMVLLVTVKVPPLKMPPPMPIGELTVPVIAQFVKAIVPWFVMPISWPFVMVRFLIVVLPPVSFKNTSVTPPPLTVIVLAPPSMVRCLLM
jgi:hypothetical protein